MRKQTISIILLMMFLFSILSPLLNFPIQTTRAVTTYYVATTGSDANPGTIGAPFKSIRKANNVTVAGDTVLVRAGTYRFGSGNETHLTKNGTSANWITFSPAPGETVVIDGKNQPGSGSTDSIIEIHHASYIRFTGFKLYNATRSGIHIYYEDNYIRIDNCTIWNTSQRGIIASPEGSGLYIQNVSIDDNQLNWTNNNWDGTAGGETISFSGTTVKNFRIHGNTVKKSGRECIDLKQGSNWGNVSYNTIWTGGYGGTTYGSPGIYVDGYSYVCHNITLYNNYINGSGNGINLGAELAGAIRSINVSNNIVWVSAVGYYPLLISTNAANAIFKNIYIYSNTFFSISTSTACFRNTQYRTRLTNLVIKNNIFQSYSYYQMAHTHLNVTDGVTTITNNLYYRSTSIGHNQWTATDDPANGWGTSPILFDPLFVSPSTGNFNITSLSPAIDSGTSTLVSSVDYAGVLRPKLSGYDIGAYECTTAPVITNITKKFGYEIKGTLGSTDLGKYGAEASNYTCTYGGTAQSITVFIDNAVASGAYLLQGALYYASNLTRIATTETKAIPGFNFDWMTLNFSSPKPRLTAGTNYLLAVDSNATDGKIQIYYDNEATYWSARDTVANAITFANPWVSDATYASRKFSIYCTYYNNIPTISVITPTNDSITASHSPSCAIIASDLDNTMNIYFYENTTGGWVLRQTNSTVSNGTYRWTYSQASGYLTKYWWKVCVNDSLTNVSAIYHFTTESKILFLSETPTNSSLNQRVSLTSWSINILDNDGDPFSWTIETSPNIGSTSGAAASNGTKTLTLSYPFLDTTYTVYVNATDGAIWKRAWYTFSTNLTLFVGDSVHVDNEYYGVTILKTFDNASHGTHWVSFNGIGFNVSYAGTSMWGNFSSIISYPKSNTGWIVNWTHNRSSALQAFYDINGLKPTYDYILYTNGTAASTYTTTAAGVLSFTAAASSHRRRYAIYDAGIPAGWYVAGDGSPGPAGSDANPGTLAAPFHTIRKAINASSTGDTIYLRGGEYNHISSATTGILINRSGTSSSWFTISGYPVDIAAGYRVVIDATGYGSLGNNYGVFNCGQIGAAQSYIRITNLEIENVTGVSACSAIRGWGYFGSSTGVSHHIMIDNCTFNNIKYNTLKFWTEKSTYRPNNITIENCTFNYTSWDWGGGTGYMGESVTLYNTERFIIKDNRFTICYKSMIDCANGSRHGQIFRNTFSNGTSSTRHAIYLDGSESSSPYAYNTNITIYNNLIYSPFRGAICIGNEQNGGNNNITIYNNVLNSTSASTANHGILFEAPSGGAGVSQLFDHITIAHNTISLRNEGYPLYFDSGVIDTEIREIIIANNIFQSAGGGDYQIYSGSLASTSSKITRANNLYNHTSKDEDTQWTDGTGKFEATAIRLGAEFVDRVSGNLHLNATSPAINTASATYGVPFDYEDTARPQAGAYEIGAYEELGGGAIPYPPLATNPGPASSASSIGTPITHLNITISDQNADPMDLYWRSNYTGVWAAIDDNITVFNGTYNCPTPGFTGSTRYWWSVNITDGSYWCNKTFNFSIWYPTIGITLNKIRANWTTTTNINITWTKGANTTNTYIYRSNTGYISGAVLVYSGTNSYYNDTPMTPTIRYYYTLRPYNSVSLLFGSYHNVSLAETDDTSYLYTGASWIEFQGWMATDKNIQTRFNYATNPSFTSTTTNDTVLETSYVTTGIVETDILGLTQRGQRFQTGADQYYIYNVSIKARRSGSPGILYCNLTAVGANLLPTGPALSTGSVNANLFSTSPTWYNITMTAYYLAATTNYAITISTPTGSSGNKIYIALEGPGGYANGQLFRSSDGGATFVNHSSGVDDMMFKIWGKEPATTASFLSTSNTTRSTSAAFSIEQDSLNSGQLYYYRVAANDTQGNMTRGNIMYSLTNPGVPTFLYMVPVFTNNSLHITWLNGTGVNRTVIVNGGSGYPSTPADGTTLYNGTATSVWLTGISFNHTYSISLFSFTIWSGLSRWSSGVSIPWGGCTFTVRNESRPWQVINATIMVTDSLGLNPVYFPHVYGYYSFNISEIPYGDDTRFYISNSSYQSRLYVHDIEVDTFYNFTFYLAPFYHGENISENQSKSYMVQVINEQELAVQGADVRFYRYMNYTGNYTYIGGFVSDGNGQGNVILFPYDMYMVKIDCEGYENATDFWIPNIEEQSLIKYFKLYYDTGTIEPSYIFNEQIHVSADLNNATSVLRVNYTDDLGLTTNCVVYIYEVNTSTGLITLYHTRTTTLDSDFTFSIPANNSNDYVIYFEINHDYFGYKKWSIYITGWHTKMTTMTKFNLLFTLNFGWMPIGWSNFVCWWILLGCFFAFGRRDTYMIMFLLGFLMLFINYYIGFNTTVALLAGGVLPVMLIFFGILMLIRDRNRFSVGGD